MNSRDAKTHRQTVHSTLAPFACSRPLHLSVCVAVHLRRVFVFVCECLTLYTAIEQVHIVHV